MSCRSIAKVIFNDHPYISMGVGGSIAAIGGVFLSPVAMISGLAVTTITAIGHFYSKNNENQIAKVIFNDHPYISMGVGGSIAAIGGVFLSPVAVISGLAVTTITAIGHFYAKNNENQDDELDNYLKEREDSHVQIKHILTIGNTRLGFRHVTGKKLAEHEQNEGVEYGCALNISFCEGENIGEKAKFYNLNEKVSRQNNPDTSLIPDYEKAITTFIKSSISMDLPCLLDIGSSRVRDILCTSGRTYFMLIASSFFSAADAYDYEGLGRWPKDHIPKEHVLSLPSLDLENIGIKKSFFNQIIKSKEQAEKIISYLASLHRKILLDALVPENLEKIKRNK